MKNVIKALKGRFEEPIHPLYKVSKKYIDRELSWLEFNKRVLYQTIRKDIPLMERFNFLNITSSNLDEFIMVRLSSVMNSLCSSKKQECSVLTPEESYRSILSSIKVFKNMQWTCYSYLYNQLKDTGVEIYKAKDLSKKEKQQLEKMFFKNIYPILIPRNFDTTKEYPELSSKQLTIAVLLEDNDLQVVSFIPLDNRIPKIFKVPNKDNAYITLEEVIYAFLDKIYYKKNIVDYGMIKILREADIELDHNQDIFITERMKDTLLQRRYSRPIFMETTKNISDSFVKLLYKIFGLKKSHVFKSQGIIDFEPLTKLYPNDTTLRYSHFQPQFPSELLGDYDIFSAIDERDILLHHPYDSYEPVIKFLEQSATDKNVISIRQTLYRVSSDDSPIVNALCNAARNGKSVAVILEIKARFDEEKNISLIEKLKNSGVQLVYGVESLKTHCKFIIVSRREGDKITMYTHVGTGNYNDKTAKLYTDLSYFTNSFKLGKEVTCLFNMISGFSEPTKHNERVFFSPYNLRTELERNIDKEIKHAEKGKKALVALKVNSLCDKKIIDKLYEASKKGVYVVVFCRGICGMKPINDNITIHSLVGRYLEHSRIYYFHNTGDMNLYISSADLLTRNLDKRYELLVPITDVHTKEKLRRILNMYFADTFNTFVMDEDGTYSLLSSKKKVNIHDVFMTEAIENYKLKSMPKLFKKHN